MSFVEAARPPREYPETISSQMILIFMQNVMAFKSCCTSFIANLLLDFLHRRRGVLTILSFVAHSSVAHFDSVRPPNAFASMPRCANVHAGQLLLHNIKVYSVLVS